MQSFSLFFGHFLDLFLKLSQCYVDLFNSLLVVLTAECMNLDFVLSGLLLDFVDLFKSVKRGLIATLTFLENLF